MTTEEAQKVLDEMQDVRPELLNDEAKRLFEAIMKIANEKDRLKDENIFLKRQANAFLLRNRDLEKERNYYRAEYNKICDKIKNFKEDK